MDFLIPLYCLCGIVWSIPIIRSGHAMHFAVLLLGVGTIFGPAFFAIDGPIQISVDRLLWAAMIGLVVVQWRLGNLAKVTMTRIDWLLLAITAYLFVSCQRGGQPPTGSSPTARWLFYILLPLGTYWVTRVVNLQVTDIRWIKRLLIALGTYLSITAVFEVTGMHGFVYPRYIVDPQQWIFYGRARGPLMNPIGNGMIMTVALVASMLEFMSSGRRGKLGYGILCMLMLFGCYATLTRSVWMGAVAAVGVVVLVRTPRWVRVLGLSAAMVFGGAMAMGLKDQLMSMKRDKALSAADAAKSVELRPLLAVVAWEMFKAKPIVGHGFGHYFEHNSPFHDNRSYDLPLAEVREYAQHNTFLMLLVDTGAVGLLAYSVLLLMLFAVAWQLACRRGCNAESNQIGLLVLAMIAAYVCNAMFHDLVVIPMVQTFLLMLGGTAVTVFARGFAADLAHVATAARGRTPLLPAPGHGMPRASMNRSC
tara:strand:- start:244889 stop:246322 length:1434 start_codon:yes stop_codon:yes gene_type:complete